MSVSETITPGRPARHPVLRPSFLLSDSPPGDYNHHYAPCEAYRSRHPEAAQEIASLVHGAVQGLGVHLVRLNPANVEALFSGWHDRRGLPPTNAQTLTLCRWAWGEPELAALDFPHPEVVHRWEGCFLKDLAERVAGAAGWAADAILLSSELDLRGSRAPRMALVSHPRVITREDRDTLGLVARICDLDLAIERGVSWVDPFRTKRIWLSTPGLEFDLFDECQLVQIAGEVVRDGGRWPLPDRD